MRAVASEDRFYTIPGASCRTRGGMASGGKPGEEAVPPRRDALVFLGIAALAFALRFVHLLQARAVPLFDAVIMDGRSYSEWADRIAAGDWLGDTIFYQAPLYPYLLAVIKLAVGDDLWRIRLVQIALGSLSCSILFLAGRSFFSRRAGIWAGILLALYPPAIFFDGLIQKASLGLLGTVLLLWLVARARREPSPARSGLVGASLAILMLTREETILLVPVLAAWCWLGLREREPARRLGLLLGYAAGLALVLVPVGLRNLAVGGEFVLTTSQAGPNFYIGNHAGATGTYVPLRPGRQNTAYERKDAVELAEQALGRSLSPKEVSDYWRDRALAFIRSEPGAWLRLLARKVDLLLNAYEMPDYEDQYFYERDCSLLRGLDAFWNYGILLPLGLAGILLTRRRWREIGVLHALIATIAAAVVLFYVFARYRYSVVPILLLFAGAGLVEGFGAIREKRYERLLLPGLVLLASAWISNRTLFEKDFLLSESLNNAASALSAKGDDARAIALFEESLKIRPDAPEVVGNLGLSQMRLGRVEAAIGSFRRAAELRAGDWKAHLRFGAALLQTGRVDEGTAAIERALSIDRKAVLESALVMMRQTNGRDLVAIDVLASALAANGRFEEAVATGVRAEEIPSEPAQAALRARIREQVELHRRGRLR
jgi:Flp pilus assembly protein TadD